MALPMLWCQSFEQHSNERHEYTWAALPDTIDEDARRYHKAKLLK